MIGSQEKEHIAKVLNKSISKNSLDIINVEKVHSSLTSSGDLDFN